MSATPKLIDTLEKKIKIECLIAFIHSRITGVMNDGTNVSLVFSNRYSEKEAIKKGKDIEDAINEIATIDKINKKIEKCPKALANMYYFNYTKLINRLDKLIAKDEGLIEGLIGLHLLYLATSNGMLNYGDEETIQYYKDSIDLYENDNYTSDETINQTVKKMREVAYDIFDFYWKKRGTNEIECKREDLVNDK